METQRIPYGNTVSGHCVWHMFRFEFLHLGQTVQRCRTVQHNDIAVVHVVFHCRAIGVFGILFRLSQAAVSASGSNEYDSETSARPTVVHEFGVMVI